LGKFYLLAANTNVSNRSGQLPPSRAQFTSKLEASHVKCGLSTGCQGIRLTAQSFALAPSPQSGTDPALNFKITCTGTNLILPCACISF
jgi:hypothetical protein